MTAFWWKKAVWQYQLLFCWASSVNPQGFSENNLGRWFILLKHFACVPAELHPILKIFASIHYVNFKIQILSFSVFALPPSFSVTCLFNNTIHHLIIQIINWAEPKHGTESDQGRHLGTSLWHIVQFRCVAITALKHPLASYSWFPFFPHCFYVPRILMVLSYKSSKNY